MIKVFHPCITKEDLAAASKSCLEGGHFDAGRFTDQFEQEIALYLGVPASWVLCTNSCTAALATCYHFLVSSTLQAPVLTWPGSWCAHHGKVLFYDEAPAERIAAVVVDLYGRGIIPDTPARPLIIDGAHNCLSRRLVNNWLLAGKADAITFSFGPVKQLTTIRGGAIISPHVSGNWRSFVHFGAHGRVPHLQKGGNYTMPDFNAVIGLEQLKRFDAMQKRRQSLLTLYRYNISPEVQMAGGSGHICAACIPVYRDELREALAAAGVQTSHHYPLPSWVEPTAFPVSAERSREQLTLPLHLKLKNDDVLEICEIFRKEINE